MRYFLDTQLYSYLANGTIPRRNWRTALARRELWLSPVTAYELLEGLLNASPHTYPLSLAALAEAADIHDQRILAFLGAFPGRFPGPSSRRGQAARTQTRIRRWLEAAARHSELPRDFYAFRHRVQIESILAHELAHHVHHHIGKSLALEAATSFVGFWLADAALRAFTPRFGFLFLLLAFQ